MNITHERIQEAYNAGWNDARWFRSPVEYDRFNIQLRDAYREGYLDGEAYVHTHKFPVQKEG